MNESPSVLLLEFNELAPGLMERFIAGGHLPNFERLRSQSTVMITDPEADQSGLEPWIQWVTVHTGVAGAEHGIEKLGEADQLEYPTIGETVAAQGGQVWLCGSMNLPRRAAGGGTYLPDPWNPDATPNPASMRAFSDFVRANVQEHSNATARQTPGALARFGWFLARHGLSMSTVRASVAQLVAERRGTRGRWARASVLDRFQWDVFRWYWRRQQPAFATFFSNSTAHFQHVFWRNLEPELFANKPGADEQRRLGDAVLHGYREMDRIVGEASVLAEEAGATLMFCTGLSQQPYVQAEAHGGKYIYRPHRFEDVVDVLGIQGVRQIAPVMAEQFHLYFHDEVGAQAAGEVLRSAMVDGEPAFTVRNAGVDVFTGCAVHGLVPVDATLRTGDDEIGVFSDLFYRSESPKSGFHHPDGMWWIRTGEHEQIDRPIPLRSIAPTILELLDIDVPDSMKAAPVAAPG